MSTSHSPQDAAKVAESISSQLNLLIADVTRILREVSFFHFFSSSSYLPFLLFIIGLFTYQVTYGSLSKNCR